MDDFLGKFSTIKGFMYFLTFSFEAQLAARLAIVIVIDLLCCGCYVFEEGLTTEFSECILSNEYDKYYGSSPQFRNHFICARESDLLLEDVPPERSNRIASLRLSQQISSIADRNRA